MVVPTRRIYPNGRILRSSNSNDDPNLTLHKQLEMVGHHFSFRRFFTVAIPFLLLVVTNPYNEILPSEMLDQIIPSSLSTFSNSKNKSTKNNNNKQSSSSFRRWLTIPSSATNYGLFALEDRFDGVSLIALGQQQPPLWQCSFNNNNGRQHQHQYVLSSSSSTGATTPWCEWIADTMCHHKPLLPLSTSISELEQQDLPFTMHRIMCFSLLLSSFFYYCIGPWAPPIRLFHSQKQLYFLPAAAAPWLEAILGGSVLYRPTNLLYDLFHQHVTVYPTFVAMEQILQIRFSSTNAPFRFPMAGTSRSFNFILTVWILVFVIGGAANYMASKIARQDIYSMTTRLNYYAPVIAASLAYQQAATPFVRSSSFWNMWGLLQYNHDTHWGSFWGFSASSMQIYWYSAVWIVMDGMFNGTTSSRRQWFPSLVAWLVAGFAGMLLAKYPLDMI